MRHDPPAAPAVRETLERILSSETFKRSERARSLLAYLIEREQAGEAERLKGYAIGVDVFGKDQEFDSSTDAVVRVQAGRLRELLAQYYQTEGHADSLRVAIPLGAYVPTYEAALPCETVRQTPRQQLWQFLREAGSAVARRSRSAGPRSSEPAYGRKVVGVADIRLLWGALALVATLLVIVAYRTDPIDGVVSGNAAAAPGASWQAPAVVASTGMEMLPTIRILTDGDDPAVARVSALFRTAFASFETINLIGGEFSRGDRNLPPDPESFVLSVAPGAEGGNVSVELQSLGSGRVLINRSLSASQVTPDVLEAKVAGLVSAMAPVDGVIYGYLKQNGLQSALVNCLILNNAFYLDWTERRHFLAYGCFEKLAEARAKSPLVYASLASLRTSARVHGYAYPPNPQDDETMTLARRAVQIGPTNASVYRTMGYIHSQRGDKTEAIHWMRKAYELNTFDLSGAAAYGYALVFCGQYREAASVLQRAVEASSVHPAWWDYSLFLAQFMLGDMNRASAATGALATLKKAHYLAALLLVAHSRGDERRADELVAELVVSYPKFAADPETMFRDADYPPDLTDKLVNALRTAGIGRAG